MGLLDGLLDKSKSGFVFGDERQFVDPRQYGFFSVKFSVDIATSQMTALWDNKAATEVLRARIKSQARPAHTVSQLYQTPVPLKVEVTDDYLLQHMFADAWFNLLQVLKKDMRMEYVN